MHKKIIAAMGVAGFLMLSYVKVNYAVDYEFALNAAEATTAYTEEVAEVRLVQADLPVVMTAVEQETTQEEVLLDEALLDESEEEIPEETQGITEAVTETVTQQQTQPVTTAQAVTEPVTESLEPTLSQVNSAALEALVLSEYNPASARVVNVTQTEYDILLRIVEAEATGKDVLSKMLVAGVVLNRVNNHSFPGSIEGVVFQKTNNVSQFSPLDDGRYYSVNISSGTIEAVNRVLAGEDYSQGALYFAAEWVVNGRGCWASRHFNEVFRYGGHVFFAP